MKAIKIILIALTVVLCNETLSAQNNLLKNWEFTAFAGYNLGGTTPLPLPAEIRKIKSWSPGFTPTLAFHATKWINPRWGVTTGIGIELKGMVIEADVKYWQTNLVVGEGAQTGTFSGTFSGTNRTKMRNGYVTIPLLATFRPYEKWTFYFGGYVSSLQDAKFEGSASDGYIRNGGPTGDKINVTEATYDFSDEMSKVDAGIMASADWYFTRKMAVKGQLSWGLVPVFPSSFKGISYNMYNVYVMLGLAYKI